MTIRQKGNIIMEVRCDTHELKVLIESGKIAALKNINVSDYSWLREASLKLKEEGIVAKIQVQHEGKVFAEFDNTNFQMDLYSPKTGIGKDIYIEWGVDATKKIIDFSDDVYKLQLKEYDFHMILDTIMHYTEAFGWMKDESFSEANKK